MRSPHAIPLDVLLLVLLGSAQLFTEAMHFLVVIPLFFYIILELWVSVQL
jgi:hypothetical protein